MISRRRFLSTASAAPLAVTFGSLLPDFLLRAAEPGATKETDRILVVVQLTGGNDGLNTVVPYSNELYRRARKTLAVPPEDVLKIDGQLGFHPSLRGFADLLESDRLAIVQGVGYPQPNRSHFESMDIWHSCHRKDVPRTDGWIGRYLDGQSRESGQIPAIHIGTEQQPLALASRNVRVTSIRSLSQFRLEGTGDISSQSVTKLAGTMRERPDDLLGFVQSSTTSALSVSHRFEQSGGSLEPSDAYPATDLGRKLGSVARLILTGLPTRIYYVELDGFDTHARQSAAHAALLRQLGDGVRAFLDDMAANGEADRILVTCFSEFGRRLAENASEGTDHGAAAPMFLAGKPVRSGLIGRHPALDDLDADGDLKHHTDFRQVYATVLKDWLGCNSESILGSRFATVPAL